MSFGEREHLGGNENNLNPALVRRGGHYILNKEEKIMEKGATGKAVEL